MSQHVLYDDGRFKVSQSIIATPHRLYPLANASVRVRRDPLWAGLATAATVGLAISVYGDLLATSETISMGAFALGALAIGGGISLLAVDVPGHPRSIVFGRTSKIRAVYRAVLAAKLREIQPKFSPEVVAEE